MKPHEEQGKKKQIEGGKKEIVGAVLGDRSLQHEGTAERIAGVVEEKLGKAQRKVGDAVEDLGKSIKH